MQCIGQRVIALPEQIRLIELQHKLLPGPSLQAQREKKKLRRRQQKEMEKDTHSPITSGSGRECGEQNYSCEL